MFKLVFVVCSVLSMADGVAVPKVDCSTVPCPAIACPNQIPPAKGECCPRCPAEPVECSKESCGVDLCPNPRPPGPGQCCPSCEDCRVVTCAAPPPCPDGKLIFPPGKCCQICQRTNALCVVNGKSFADGSTFWKMCNKCTCSTGNAACTLKACAPGCYKSGTRYGDKASVPSRDPCKTCTCKQSNGKYRISCVTKICPRATCANPVAVPGKCCPECGGSNLPCMIGGKAYRDGSILWNRCNKCTCSNGNAGCTEMACAPGCYRKGKRYDASASVPNTNPCKTCTCNLSNGNYSISCVTKTCPKPTCANPVSVPGVCCPECEGSGLPCVVDGTSHPDGLTFWNKCNRCTCTNGNAGCTEKACAPGCYKDGRRYDAQATVPGKNPCEICTCNLFKGKYSTVCAVKACAKPPCTNPVSVPGKCCPVCEGSRMSCKVNGKIYKSGTSFMNDCNRCRCIKGKARCTKKACPPKCSDGSKPLPNRSCGGVEGGEMCPDQFACQTSSNAAVSGICCRRN